MIVPSNQEGAKHAVQASQICFGVVRKADAETRYGSFLIRRGIAGSLAGIDLADVDESKERLDMSLAFLTGIYRIYKNRSKGGAR